MMIEGISRLWLERACGERGYEIHTDYSGRGMYGKTCLGIVAGADQMVMVQLLVVSALDLSAEGLNWDDVLEEIDDGPTVSTDAMGTDIVYYWREVQVGDSV